MGPVVRVTNNINLILPPVAKHIMANVEMIGCRVVHGYINRSFGMAVIPKEMRGRT
jgi:hypothetical protein